MASILSKVRSAFNMAIDATKQLLTRLFLAICLFCLYVVVSMIVYAVMRQFLVPQKTHILPVHLMFSSSCKPNAIHNHQLHDNLVKPLDHYDSARQKCEYPFAEFYLAKGQSLLSPGHVYSIAVQLDLPESPANADIGMFMVNLTLYSYSGTPTVTSLRSTILHYKSSLLKTLSTVFFSLPMVLGFMEENQRQMLVMLEDYSEPYTEGTVFARVTILSHEVQVYNVELVLDAVFSGLSYYLYHWPISMAIIIISGIFFSLASVTILNWIRKFINRWNRYRYRRRHSSLRMNIRGPELDPIPEEDEQPRRGVVTPPVEDLATTDSRTETGSTISEVSEVTITTTSDTDISELDEQLQKLADEVVTVSDSTGTRQALEEGEGLRQRNRTENEN